MSNALVGIVLTLGWNNGPRPLALTNESCELIRKPEDLRGIIHWTKKEHLKTLDLRTHSSIPIICHAFEFQPYVLLSKAIVSMSPSFVNHSIYDTKFQGFPSSHGTSPCSGLSKKLFWDEESNFVLFISFLLSQPHWALSNRRSKQQSQC